MPFQKWKSHIGPILEMTSPKADKVVIYFLNGHYFADNIFFKKNLCVLIQISLKFVFKVEWTIG